jgi:Flp pilus assembly protein TadB
MTLAATVAAWIVAAFVASRRSKRRRRRLRANQLRSRVRLHALAVDVFKQRLVADDLVRPDRRLLEHLRRQSWIQAHGFVAIVLRTECCCC